MTSISRCQKTTLGGSNQAKDLLGLVGNRNWTGLIYSSNRQEARLMVQIITDHGNLRYHFQKMGFSAEGGCRWCKNGNETALHLLNTFPVRLRTRMKWFGEYETSPDLIRSAATPVLAAYSASGRRPVCYNQLQRRGWFNGLQVYGMEARAPLGLNQI